MCWLLSKRIYIYISMIHCNKRISFRHLRPIENNLTFLYTGIGLSFRWPWDKKNKKRRRKNPIEMLFSTSYQNKRIGRASCFCVHVCIRMMYVYVWCLKQAVHCAVFEESSIIKKSSKLAIYTSVSSAVCAPSLV